MLGRRPVIVVMLLCSVACSVPATTFEAYRSKAVDAAEDVASQARTAILTAELAGADRLLATAVTVQLEDAETTAVGAVESFASAQPPDARADRLRARILPLLERAADAITRMRFEAKRGHIAAALELRSSLLDPTAALERYAGSNA